MEVSETKKYELCFWLKDDGAAPLALFDSVKNVIQKAGGAVITEHQPEKRNLAYPIQKQRSGFWSEIVFSSLPEAVKQIKKDLKYEGAILRQIILSAPEMKPLKEHLVRPVQTVKTKTASELSGESPKQIQEQLDSKLKEILES
jgi:ribosomal protein S6